MGAASPTLGSSLEHARPNAVDLRASSAGIDRVAATLDRVAGELRSLWSSALGRADSKEITRLVEASHAVHRAVNALRADEVIAARSWLPCPHGHEGRRSATEASTS
jgi:hypothetical protein